MVDTKIIQGFADWCYDHFPPEKRTERCAEECAELIQICLKMGRADYDQAKLDQCRDKLVEEMSHVLFTMENVRRHFNITPEELDEKVKEKYAKYGVELPE